MSRGINVNPGQYKVAGRERQGEDINHAHEKAALAKADAVKSRRTKAGQNAGAQKR
jgi:hypothetical protein